MTSSQITGSITMSYKVPCKFPKVIKSQESFLKVIAEPKKSCCRFIKVNLEFWHY